MIGIVWTDLDVAYQGISLLLSYLYHNNFHKLELLPMWVTQICFESNDYLLKIVNYSTSSNCVTRFQAHRIYDLIHAQCAPQAQSSFSSFLTCN